MHGSRDRDERVFWSVLFRMFYRLAEEESLVVTRLSMHAVGNFLSSLYINAAWFRHDVFILERQLNPLIDRLVALWLTTFENICYSFRNPYRVSFASCFGSAR